MKTSENKLEYCGDLLWRLGKTYCVIAVGFWAIKPSANLEDWDMYIMPVQMCGEGYTYETWGLN